MVGGFADMKILVADKIAAAGVDFFKAQPGFEVVEAYGTPADQLPALVADVHAIAVRSETKITAAVLAAAPLLQVVGRAGVGVDNIDVDAATQRGVVVLNTPDGNTIATAELTFAHLLACARPVPQACLSMREGRWDRKHFGGVELRGKNLGICGLGRIGTEVARRAQAFGMKVLAYDPFLSADRAAALEVEAVSLDEVLRRSDFITVHMPLTDATRNMIDAAALAKARQGVCLVNVARGGIINEMDLVAAIKSGQVGAAGLDVFEEEPLAADHPLRGLANVVLTPHLGASTREAQESVGLEVAEALTQVLQGGVIRNAVNMPSVDARTLKVLRPYLTLAAKVGTILQQVGPAQVRKLRLSFWGRVTEVDVLPVARSFMRGWLRRVSGEAVNDVNAPHVLRRLGIELEIVQSSTDSDYTELVRAEAVGADGEVGTVEATMLGKSHRPRIVHLSGRDVEANPEGFLLLVENEDVPGQVGVLGSILGKYTVNIANMSLSRNAVGGIALTALELDTRPSAEILAEIRAHPTIRRVTLVETAI